MGVLDIPKMIAKAREAQNRAKKIQAAGQHGSASMLVNGLIDWVEDEVSVDAVMQKANISADQKALVEKVVKITREDLRLSFEDAKKQLQKKMQETMNVDDIKDLLG